MTPSTNKCIKCGEEIKYGMTFTRNANGTAQHAPGDWCKPTVPSVCDVRVQTAEGVNIPCRLPRPCKDHEPSGVRMVCLRLGCPCHEGKECESAKRVFAQQEKASWSLELKRQCEVRGLPYRDVAYLVGEIVATVEAEAEKASYAKGFRYATVKYAEKHMENDEGSVLGEGS